MGMCETSLSARVKSYLWKCLFSKLVIGGRMPAALREGQIASRVPWSNNAWDWVNIVITPISYKRWILSLCLISLIYGLPSCLQNHFLSALYTDFCVLIYYQSISTLEPLWGHITQTCYFIWGFPNGYLCQNEDASCFSTRQRYEKESNRIVDTMKTLSFHDNFIKPWSAKYNLLRLLTCWF